MLMMFEKSIRESYFMFTKNYIQYCVCAYVNILNEVMPFGDGKTSQEP